jgi:hypothetical protein
MGRIYQSDGVLLFDVKYVNHINFKGLVFGEFTPFKRDINPSHE